MYYVNPLALFYIAQYKATALSYFPVAYHNLIQS